MIYKLFLILFLIVVIICSLNKNCKIIFNKIEPFNQAIIDSKQYNKMHKIQGTNNKIKKDINGPVKKSIILSIINEAGVSPGWTLALITV